ncbi:MAG: hypothetical protein HY866_10620, partial [Chloroflexi bacterium]|nr:hypothetical protein [Chloroflexota bacterium]
DRYAEYEERFDPLKTDRKARRSRKAKINHTPKKTDREIIDEISDPIGLEDGFNPTYCPSRYEQGWLLSSLAGFYDQQLITDVLSLVRGGKEANVYVCAAHESTGVELLAAKVYRPHMLRQIRNDSLYKQGRDILTGDGRAVKKTDHRIMRAVNKKTDFGVQVQHTSWLMHEYTTLQQLHQAKAAVPQPFAASENAILMSYCGDEQMAAPALSAVRLDPEEAEPLFKEAMRNIEIMLQHEMVHGDLSAYNILYWEGEITLIDFPQVTSLHANRSSYQILLRDVTRTCQYFAQQGVRRDPGAITEELWNRYWRPIYEDLPPDDDEL